MAVYFCDTSAIVKRYSNEVGSAWVKSITDPAAGNPVYLARITEVEVASAIMRGIREGRIPSGDARAAITAFLHDLINQYRVVQITPALADEAVSIVQLHALRGYDAVQLAAALEINTSRLSVGMAAVILVSADVTLNVAAAEGLAVENPNTYP